MPWSESSTDIDYYRTYLNDLTVRAYVAPTAVASVSYSESAGDLSYYRRYLGDL